MHLDKIPCPVPVFNPCGMAWNNIQVGWCICKGAKKKNGCWWCCFLDSEVKRCDMMSCMIQILLMKGKGEQGIYFGLPQFGKLPYNYSRLMGPESRKLPHLLLMRDCSHSTTWQTRPRSGWKNVHFDGVAWVHCGLILCAESSGKGCRL